MLITDEHGLFGLGDAAIYPTGPYIPAVTPAPAPVVPSMPPDKPLILAAPFGLYPRWAGSDTSKQPDWYQWQLLPGMTSTAAAPSGSYASVDAGRQAMQDWNTQRQAAKAAAAAQQQTLTQQIAVMTQNEIEASRKMVPRVQPGTPVNWGPLPVNSLPMRTGTPGWPGWNETPQQLTVTGKSPLLWWIAGAALVAGAGFLLLRRKK